MHDAPGVRRLSAQGEKNGTMERYVAANDAWVVHSVPDPPALKRAFLSACVVDAA